MNETPRYYVPHSSPWPIIGSIALFLTAFGGASFIHQSTEKVAAEGSYGEWVFYLGLALIAFMMFGWFGTVIRESLPEKDDTFIAIRDGKRDSQRTDSAKRQALALPHGVTVPIE